VAIINAHIAIRFSPRKLQHQNHVAVAKDISSLIVAGVPKFTIVASAKGNIGWILKLATIMKHIEWVITGSAELGFEAFKPIGDDNDNGNSKSGK